MSSRNYEIWRIHNPTKKHVSFLLSMAFAWECFNSLHGYELSKCKNIEEQRWLFTRWYEQCAMRQARQDMTKN